MSNSREIAAQILTNIYTKFEFFETAVLQNKNFSFLDHRDKAFVRLIILNTLRRNGQIMSVINQFIKKPLRKKDIFILNLIRISICQILFLDIKEYSIVNTAVQIAKNYKLDKFINGLLRNICRNKKEINENLKLETNIPKWIKNDIKNNLGVNTLRKISSSIICEPYLDIKIKKDNLQKINWEEVLDGKLILNDLIRVKNEGYIEDKPFFKDGFWWVQNFTATLPVRLINSIFDKVDKNKVAILDVGAAPGGKSFQLIEDNFNVTSIDISERRVKRFKENLIRLNLKTEIICKDFFEHKFNKLFDCILLDAPCSASGLIQKKPEILVHNKEANLEKLISKQERMLNHASSLLKVGGHIIYCVCSILSNEGNNQIRNFLKHNNNFKTVNFDERISKYGKTLAKGMLLVTPDEQKIKGGVDGFFISIIKKVE